MGYFTLTAASLVGFKGKVVALDIQEAMLNALHRRAERAGLASRLELRVAKPTDLGIRRKGIADFFLAFYVVHEVPDPRRFFEQAYDSLKNGGRLLFVEPRGHVSQELFEQELGQASAAGFKVLNRPTIRWSWAALLTKGSQSRKGQRPAKKRR
jgi:ubiquinone/menaquinone biosynthesis C-methylase UbiE